MYYHMASITVRQAGSEMTDFATLKELGAFAFTDDGVGVQMQQHDASCNESMQRN